ncbi:dihydrodipicolinate synthase family protein [Geomicrobium sp. JSM 1781026]|uniref:dihydrodipicolinate synthase family protein n=1 Tax=Geomicrobium sp. JSM 1781026 TaxID=3344580 RepID=UPI0035C234BC
MSLTIQLPTADRHLKTYTVNSQRWAAPTAPISIKKRKVFSAVHVVADPWAVDDPLRDVGIDWEHTLAYRHHIWGLGLSVAEAMDTAQRGMGLGWSHAKELITRSVKEARAVGGEIACGAGTDQLLPAPVIGLDDVVHAYEEQCAHVEREGGRIIVMASRALARVASSPDDYARVYERVLEQVKQPVILHWLGDMFDPNLEGYWGSDQLDEAMDSCLNIIRQHESKVDGIKLSLLDASKEVEMRRRLPDSVRMYTGDDFHYPELIEGDGRHYSDALLGIFDAIAPAASRALVDLDAGNTSAYRETMDKTVPLARHIFKSPTFSYKTGVVFLAYLNGFQPHFRMIAGAESHRSVLHLARIFELADEGDVLLNPELAVRRMRLVLQQAGIS